MERLLIALGLMDIGLLDHSGVTASETVSMEGWDGSDARNVCIPASERRVSPSRPVP
jgi:hypothetical protein